MAKKYTRKHVHSLAELDLEQERIRYKTKRIEDDMLDIVSPQQLAITIISGLWNRRKKKTAAGPQYFAPSGQQKKKGKSKNETVVSRVAAIASEPAVKKILKKVGVSFLRWQAFNLALFLGKKIIHKVKEKKAAKEQLVPARR